jgi:hypothetical protein
MALDSSLVGRRNPASLDNRLVRTGLKKMPRYQVNVKTPADDRKAFIKALRTVAGISLKRAVELSIHFDRFRDSVLVAGLGKAAAEHIAETLGASGATVTVLESSLNTPMICYPEADHKFKWGRLRTLVKLR